MSRQAVCFLVILTVVQFSEQWCSSGVYIVRRSSWGARSPMSVSRMRQTPATVFIHHSAGPRCFSTTQCKSIVKSIQNYHMNSKGWDDIGYNFLVGEDGNVYEGRGWGVVGAQARGFNSRSIGICFMGNFVSRSPSYSAIQAAKALIQCGVSNRKLSGSYNLYGHKDAASTDCPGGSLYNIIKGWPHYSHSRPRK